MVKVGHLSPLHLRRALPRYVSTHYLTCLIAIDPAINDDLQSFYGTGSEQIGKCVMKGLRRK